MQPLDKNSVSKIVFKRLYEYVDVFWVELRDSKGEISVIGLSRKFADQNNNS